MEWERGETPPGRVLSNLKIAGMREFLEASAEAQADRHGEGAEPHAPAQGRGEGDADHPVESGLDEEELGMVRAAETVPDRPEDGQRPDAEQEGGGHEPLDEPVLAGRKAGPHPVA